MISERTGNEGGFGLFMALNGVERIAMRMKESADLKIDSSAIEGVAHGDLRRSTSRKSRRCGNKQNKGDAA